MTLLCDRLKWLQTLHALGKNLTITLNVIAIHHKLIIFQFVFANTVIHQSIATHI